MGSKKTTGIIVLLSLLLIGAFGIYRMNTGLFRKIEFANLETKLKDTDYAIVCLKDVSDEKKKMIKETIKDTRIQVKISNVETVEELNKTLEKYELQAESTNAYLIMIGGEIEALIDANVEDWRFKELVRWYFFNEIPASEIAYKVPKTVEEYKSIINRNKYTVTVFGYDGCTHCNLYLPHVNNLASKYGIDIYYLNRDTDINLFEDVRDLALEIPAKCVSDGVATTTLGKFGKPMTLITKKGKTVDCIKGNVKEQELEDMLLKYGIIKEGKNG